MSTLRSGLEEFRRDDLATVADAALEEDFAELQQVIQALQAERLRRLEEIARRRTYERDGFLSCVAWLASRFRMAFSAAGRDVRMASALRDMPATRAGMASGEISLCSARVLVGAHQENPEAFRESEEMLTEAARVLPVRHLERAVVRWRLAQSREGADLEEQRWEGRHLHASRTIFGMVRVDGDLDPETGEVLLTALGAVTDAQARGVAVTDWRTGGQRRADALGEICRQFLDRSDRPVVAGERPHMIITTDVVAIRGEPGGRAELDQTGPIHPHVARRIACDAAMSRVITRGPSEPRDVGRRTSVVPPSMRRAVVIRDTRCRFPGCDRPQSWCDAHHVVHWADGGPTALSNLILLCRPHHRLVHGRFEVEMVAGRPRFRRPDGTVMEDRAPP